MAFLMLLLPLGFFLLATVFNRIETQHLQTRIGLARTQSRLLAESAIAVWLETGEPVSGTLDPEDGSGLGAGPGGTGEYALVTTSAGDEETIVVASGLVRFVEYRGKSYDCKTEITLIARGRGESAAITIAGIDYRYIERE